ncbi:endonuclease [Bacteroidia bacterium]|nr:endonuclease [Bacteroidia bacterium]
MAILGANAQNYEVGTSTALWGNPTAADLQEAKKCGVNYIEVALNTCYRGVPENEVEPCVRAMKAKIDSAGLSVWSIHLPFSRTLDISVTDNASREENVRFIAKMIALSAIFKPSRLVLHASSEPIYDVDREQRIVNASQSIATLKNYADKIGVQLCIENLPRTCLGNTPEELLRIIGSTQGVGICFDQNHYMRGSTEYFVRVAGSKIATIHASDFEGKNECHWLPTQGIIEWGKFMKDLADIGYRGVFMYEATKDKNSKEKLTPQQVMDSFNAIKSAYNNKK